MITSVRLINFKNFADETLKLGPFTVIVGANASGKSNIRDAFRFLHGIGRGYSLAEIIGGKIGVGGQLEWEPLRGAMNEIIRMSDHGPSGIETFHIIVDTDITGQSASYWIELLLNHGTNDGFLVAYENLTADGTSILETQGPEPKTDILADDGVEAGIYPPLHRFHPTLTEMQRSSYVRREVHEIYGLLGRMRFYDFDVAQLRIPTPPGALEIGDKGQNLATVLESIYSDREKRTILLSWFEELTPMDVRGLEFPRDPSGRIHLHIVDGNDRRFSADSASGGTLKFLAVLASLLANDQPRLCFFEEIDAGIHPSRLWLLVDLIESQTKLNGFQVVTTTHSPAMLDWISDQTFENTSIVYRDEDSNDSTIREVVGLPIIQKLRKSQGLGRLLLTGWIENTLSALADKDEQSRGSDERSDHP